MPSDLPSLSARLRHLIARDGRSLREIGKKCGMTHDNLSAIQRGGTDPRVSTMGRILVALGRRWKDLDEPRERRPR